MANINRVVISGNLTKDPELRQLPSGNSVCKLRMAVNTRVKDRDSGQWTDKPNYFDVTVWGAPGRERRPATCKRGSGLLVDGRLEWREWDAQDGTKRQAVEIIAENTQFIGGREAAAAAAAESAPPTSSRPPAARPCRRRRPIADDDDIPF